MTTPCFRSSLAETMRDLVTFKRIQGFDYTVQANFLEHFDSFLCEQGYGRSCLDREIVEDYVAHTANGSANTRYSRLSCVRVLSRFLHQRDSESYVLRALPVSRPSLPRWYLYSSSDIRALLEDARSLGPPGSLRPHCFYLLLGLLYVTGLRVGEALALNLRDVDTSRELLLVRKGKFGKERYVLMHRTTVRTVQQYLIIRGGFQPSGAGSPLFLNTSGERLTYEHTASTFRRMVEDCSIGCNAPQRPRLHDLRHSYACNCLLKWYAEGADVNAKLPILATAMGHVNVEATQIYLHVSSRLLGHAAQRFHGTFAASCKGE